MKIFLFFLLSSAGWTNLDKLGQMWTNLDKVGQNCVDFGERMCYDINVPRKAQGLFSKNAEQLLERHVEIVPLFCYKERRKKK